MPDIDQRSGIDHRDTDRRSGISLRRTVVSGWVLAAVIGLAGVGTAVGATPDTVARPAPVAATVPVAGLDPLALLPTAQVSGPTALPGADATPSAPAVDAPVQLPSLGTGTAGGSVGGPPAQLRTVDFTTAAPDQRASIAVRTALAQLGLPYVWGGNGPTNGDAGFDCSGLTTFSYAAAGVPLPRTAHTQYNSGPHVPAGAPLQPGDLVFYGTTAKVRHVGMYLGAGRMVNAPTFGKPVQVAFYRYGGDSYLGATRPAAAPGSLTTGVLPYVEPPPVLFPQPAEDRVFRAPIASLPAVLPQPGDAALPPEQQSAAQAIAESNAVAITTGTVTTGTVTTGTVTTGAVISGQAAPVGGTAPSTSAPVVTSPTAATSAGAVPAPSASSVVDATTSSSAPTSTASSIATATSAPASTATQKASGSTAAQPTTSTANKPATTSTTAKAVTTTTSTASKTTAAKTSTTTSTAPSTAKTTTKTTTKTATETAEETTEETAAENSEETADDEG
jgi:cell wall-associated NlpC family hydrolase